ncbi:MAG: hypothetical protein ACREN5_07170, partial [Gemmatimonadales bacterium]
VQAVVEFFWLFLAALYVWISILIGRDMQRLGRGGRGGWRYAVFFFLLPYAGVVVWLIDRHRFRAEAPPSRAPEG